jgi:hypothetical protein
MGPAARARPHYQTAAKQPCGRPRPRPAPEAATYAARRAADVARSRRKVACLDPDVKCWSGSCTVHSDELEVGTTFNPRQRVGQAARPSRAAASCPLGPNEQAHLAKRDQVLPRQRERYRPRPPSARSRRSTPEAQCCCPCSLLHLLTFMAYAVGCSGGVSGGASIGSLNGYARQTVSACGKAVRSRRARRASTGELLQSGR